MMFSHSIRKVTKTKLELRIIWLEKKRQDYELLCYTTQYNETTENQKKKNPQNKVAMNWVTQKKILKLKYNMVIKIYLPMA